MNSHRRDLNIFVIACDALLSLDTVPQDFTSQDHQVMQYYLAALTAKYPALIP